MATIKTIALPQNGTWLGLLITVVAVLAIACGSQPAPTTAVETPTLPAIEPTPTIFSPEPTPESTLPAETPTAPAATPEPTPTAAAPEALTLNVLTPQDGIGVEVGSLRVAGTTNGISIGINGLPVDVSEDGSFQRDLVLSDGVNLVEVVASDETGDTETKQLVVFYGSPTAGLPFTLLYPPDGLVVGQPEISITGVTTLDAIVGINQLPVEVNSLGIFTTDVMLEEGANLVEVVATDISGNIRFQTVAVFYTP